VRWVRVLLKGYVGHLSNLLVRLALIVMRKMMRCLCHFIQRRVGSRAGSGWGCLMNCSVVGAIVNQMQS
jgi:hypothetical protein